MLTCFTGSLSEPNYKNLRFSLILRVSQVTIALMRPCADIDDGANSPKNSKPPPACRRCLNHPINNVHSGTGRGHVYVCEVPLN